MEEPEWLLDDGTRAPMFRVEKMVVPVSKVDMVEFLKEETEITASSGDIEAAKNLLLKVNEEPKLKKPRSKE
jgi:hypothetical protein